MTLVFVLLPLADFPATDISPKLDFTRITFCEKPPSQHMRKIGFTAYLSSFFNGLTEQNLKSSKSGANVWFGRLAVYNSFSKQWNPAVDDSAWMQLLILRRAAWVSEIELIGIFAEL